MPYENPFCGITDKSRESVLVPTDIEHSEIANHIRAGEKAFDFGKCTEILGFYDSVPVFHLHAQDMCQNILSKPFTKIDQIRSVPA